MRNKDPRPVYLDDEAAASSAASSARKRMKAKKDSKKATKGNQEPKAMKGKSTSMKVPIAC